MSRRFGLALSIAMALTVAIDGRAVGPIASSDQSPAPTKTERRRLALDDLAYEGAFRLPREASNGDRFGFGGRPMAFNPAGPSLFIGTHAGRIAEVTIPKPVNSADVNALPFATYLQGFADPTEGKVSQIDGAGLSGLLIQNGKIYGAVSVYYDANNGQRVSHFSRSLKLNEPSFQGFTQVWEATRAGFVAGFMAAIPEEWQAALGGSALTGQCCVPIVSRTSLGPAGFAFDLSQVGRPKVDAAPLLYYDSGHATLGAWDGSNEAYGIATGMGGVAVIAGTRSALYFGRNGMGPACYGTGTPNQSLHEKPVGDGSKYCFDPSNASKGTHAYPYRYQVWAYDLEEFAAARANKRKPWDIKPYGLWTLEFPIAEEGINIGGVAYDQANNRIYVAQMGADKDGQEYRPLIHSYRIR